ncbi:MAG: type II toxin-antitoxin system RelE/ParE family toxin [Planctomycetota bacterium]|nr:MAG: type II toxin-antitoxin system RelE/ParE family toxin [Planctomycetota bacterium]
MHQIIWTPQALDDLQAIRDYIAHDAPRRADAFVSRLIDSTDVLQQRPLLGAVVPEVGRMEVRELIRGNYRIIYRVGEGCVIVLTVYHGARILDVGSLGEAD